MRAVLLKVALAAAILAAVPSVALAATGWKSTKFVIGQGFTGKDVITRCGSKLGVYTLHATIHVKNAGKLTEVVTIPLKGDHKAHAFHLVSMGGLAFNNLSPAERKKVFNTVAQKLDHVTIAVVHVSGKTLTVRESYKGNSAVGKITLKKYAC